MRYLLDTHTLLWFIGRGASLSGKARELIEDPQNEILVSTISLFEITIKLKTGKLSLDKPLDEFYQAIQDTLIEEIPVTKPHLLAYQTIPLIADHRDPFDRLIVATALVEQADIISLDTKFQYYTTLVKTVW
jgi:PIN domain nuclease of toxin-antitoxin system